MPLPKSIVQFVDRHSPKTSVIGGCKSTEAFGGLARRKQTIDTPPTLANYQQGDNASQVSPRAAAPVLAAWQQPASRPSMAQLRGFEDAPGQAEEPDQQKTSGGKPTKAGGELVESSDPDEHKFGWIVGVVMR